MEIGRFAIHFVVGLPMSPSGKKSIWVIMDRLTKSVHFLPITNTDSLRKLTWLYIKEIFRLNGMPKTVGSDRDPRFTSHFRKTLKVLMGTKMVNWSRPSGHWKTYWGCLLWNSRALGRITYPSLNLHTITSIRGRFKWCLMKLYLGRSVDCLYAGMRLKRASSLGRS